MGIIKNEKRNEFLYYQEREKYFLNKAIQEFYRGYLESLKTNCNELSVSVSIHIGCDFLTKAYEMRKRMDKCYVNKQVRTKSKGR